MIVALVGYRGTGKSTVAERLAARLSMQWVDADHELETEAGRSITEIFAEQGESVFRDLEEMLQETLRTAQKAADDVHENAKKEARLIMKEADIRGNRAIEKARNHVQMIRNEIVELKNQRDQFASRLGTLIQSQGDYLAQLAFTDPPVVEELVDEFPEENGQSEANEASIPDGTD